MTSAATGSTTASSTATGSTATGSAATSGRPVTRTRRLVAVLAGAAIGVTGAVAVSSAQGSGPASACARPSETDLLRAADAARALEARRPDLFAQSPRPASYDDLRLAAEWARRLAVLDPAGSCDP